MTATYALIHELTDLGVILAADGDRLDVDGPDDLLTDELLAALKKRKVALLDLLADENIEMHDCALFDPPVVEIDFYDGRRLRIPQQSTPPGWTPPF